MDNETELFADITIGKKTYGVVTSSKERLILSKVLCLSLI